MNKSIRILLALMFGACVVLSLCGQSLARGFEGDTEAFIENNPDGNKFKFAKVYITASKYIYKNALKKEVLEQFKKDSSFDKISLKNSVDALVKENINLRVARNLMDVYKKPENLLMLKVADVFGKFCEEQIAINDKERALLTKVYSIEGELNPNSFNVGAFLDRLAGLKSERRESSRKLVEASVLVTKVLVSDQTDYHGDLTLLGITNSQRRYLLDRLDEFEGENFRGEIRQGQTYFEAGISSIREILLKLLLIFLLL